MFLKHAYARRDLYPSTYAEVMEVLPTDFSQKIKNILTDYVSFRSNNLIPSLTNNDVLERFYESIGVFSYISAKISEELTNSYEKGN